MLSAAVDISSLWVKILVAECILFLKLNYISLDSYLYFTVLTERLFALIYYFFTE